jgi:hypothetical protein
LCVAPQRDTACQSQHYPADRSAQPLLLCTVRRQLSRSRRPQPRAPSGRPPRSG